MKKSLLAAMLLFVCIGTAAAQKTEREIKEPRVRFGVGYRQSIALWEQYRVVTGEGNGSKRVKPDYVRGGEFLLEGTVRITRNWNVGVGFGLGSYDRSAYGTLKTYLKAERLYGRRASRWFNYTNLGTTFNIDNNAGFTAELGGGYRMAITRRTRLDLTAGLEYLNIVGTALSFDTGSIYPRGARVNRLGFTIGAAMHF